MTSIFLFSFHELLMSLLTERSPFWFSTALSLSALIALKKHSAVELIATILAALALSFLVVKFSMPGPYGIILKIFGMHLPTFTLFSLLAPVLVLVLALVEVWTKHPIVSKNMVLLLIFVLVTFNVDVLLRGYNVSAIRAQEYGTHSEAAVYLLGKSTALAAAFSLPLLLTRALQQLLPERRARYVAWLAFALGSLLSLWLNFVYLRRILFDSMLFFE